MLTFLGWLSLIAGNILFWGGTSTDPENSTAYALFGATLAGAGGTLVDGYWWYASAYTDAARAVSYIEAMSKEEVSDILLHINEKIEVLMHHST